MLGPVLKSLHRGPKKGSGSPGPPPPQKNTHTHTRIRPCHPTISFNNIISFSPSEDEVSICNIRVRAVYVQDHYLFSLLRYLI